MIFRKWKLLIFFGLFLVPVYQSVRNVNSMETENIGYAADNGDYEVIECDNHNLPPLDLRIPDAADELRN